MATSETAIANMALGQVGNSNQITSLTEKSNEARACQLYYAQCRDEVLSAFAWPFATLIATLQLSATNPAAEWPYSYVYPSNALSLHRMPLPITIDPSLSYPLVSCDWPHWELCRLHGWFGRYRVVQDGAAKCIYANTANALIEYTKRETDPTKFPALFTKALVLRLASDVAPMVTQGDPFKLGAVAYKKYQIEISAARTQAAIEEPPQRYDGDSELLTSRY